MEGGGWFKHFFGRPITVPKDIDEVGGPDLQLMRSAPLVADPNAADYTGGSETVARNEKLKEKQAQADAWKAENPMPRPAGEGSVSPNTAGPFIIPDKGPRTERP